MNEVLIMLHAGLGELGVAAFLWVTVELINPTEQRQRRARIVAWIGLIAFLAAWIVGGYYYVTIYGTAIKPYIKVGPTPWGHTVIMEAKEHIFLLLPFLAALAVAAVKKQAQLKATLWLCGLIVLFGLAMAGMGVLISSSYRDALEALSF